MKALMLSVMMFVLSSCVFALDPIKYLDENGNEQTVTNYKFLTGEETMLTRGWYVVKGRVEFEREAYKTVEVRGNVHLILMDDSECVLNGYGCGFDGKDLGSKMYIYTQSHGKHEGKMTFEKINTWYCFYMDELYIYGGTYILDKWNKDCSGIWATNAVLKNCTMELACDKTAILVENSLVTDGVDLTIKALNTGVHAESWTIKNTDRMSKIEVYSFYGNEVSEPIKLPDGMEVTIGDDKYTDSVPAEVFNEKKNIINVYDPITSVETISHDVFLENSGWYTLNGIRLNVKPTSAGIYIHGGRKVIVR